MIRDGAVHSQEELQQRLARRGIDVAQPTLSRDLKDLGLAKTAAGYVLPGENGATPDVDREARREERLDRALREWLLDVTTAGTLVVLKTPPAAAHPVARAIDEAGLEGVAGSIAGDDTIFLATHSIAAAAKLARTPRAGMLRPPAAVPLVSGATVRASVVGATGYSGAELCAILARHPRAYVGLGVLVREEGRETRSVRQAPSGSRAAPPGPTRWRSRSRRSRQSKPDVVFLATPNETSAEVGPEILALGAKVVDVSGAFRLRDAADYPKWYGFDHPAPALLAEAVYGLTEWCGRGARRRAPRREPRLLPDVGPPCVEAARSRSSSRARPSSRTARAASRGPGRSPTSRYSFSELAGNFKAYGVGSHRHEPEMRQELGLSADAPFIFVAHLLPVVRGILSTLHVTFRAGVTPEDVAAAYARYDGLPFVQVRPAGELPDLASVVGTPRAEIGFSVLPRGRRGVIVSVIDNLLKGAASQAVQNMNRMFSLRETEGLV